MKLTDKCGYLNAAKTQRETEIRDGLGIAGTMGFELKGCYNCDGKDENCNSYFSPLAEYNKGFGRKNGM